MATIWRSDEPIPSSHALQEWIYNGLDCCVTLEVYDAISPSLNEITGETYAHALALQAPILEMECRGIRVDREAVGLVSAQLERQKAILVESLNEILREGLGIEPINPASPQQLKTLFYETLGLPPIRNRGQVTTDRKALERLRDNFYAEPLVNHILAIRDHNKKLGVLRTGVDPDGRMRTSYNIAGTDTGRLSSYASAFYTGTNLQNITQELRRIFIADPGKKIAYIDLEQAESRDVGAIIWNLFQDGTYLDFCESGDLHTSVCRMTWPHMPWTGDLKKDKLLAKQPFYRDFDYRDAAKRLGHGTNYHGKAEHMAREVRIPFPLVSEFQRSYFKAFPGIPRWHEWVRAKLIRDGWITTHMGRQRWFFGRRWENDTLNAAIAYEPQSAVADYLNRGLLQVWKSGICEVLLQVHDAIVIQFPEERENEVVPEVMRLLSWETPLLHDRTLRIPTEAFVGWNWAYAMDHKTKTITNPDGLVPYNGNDSRKRSKTVSFLDRKLL